MKDAQLLTTTTVRPLRVLSAIAAGGVLIMAGTFLIHEGFYRYQLWRVGGTWCVTMDADGTITKFFGAENCGY